MPSVFAKLARMKTKTAVNILLIILIATLVAYIVRAPKTETPKQDQQEDTRRLPRHHQAVSVLADEVYPPYSNSLFIKPFYDATYDESVLWDWENRERARNLIVP
jgi:hypothetical protein